MSSERVGKRPELPRRTGLTLLELLLVIFILALVAFSATSIVNTADEQLRFEDTRRRLQDIRTAVVGNPSRTINEEPVVSGFVTDVGRMPTTLAELLEPGSVPAWHFSGELPGEPIVGLWGGWRGSYLSALPENITGLKAYRDGWGNAGDAPNYGWKIFFADPVDGVGTTLPDGTVVGDGALVVQSYGSDGAGGVLIDPSDSYKNDYPPGLLAELHDHHLNLRGWSVEVVFVNPPGGAASLPLNDETLRLRLYFPQDGRFDWPASWPADDAARAASAYLSEDTFTVAALSLSDGEQMSHTFSFGTGVDKLVPWGQRSVVVVRNSTGEIMPRTGQYELVTLVPRSQPPNSLTINWDLE